MLSIACSVESGPRDVALAPSQLQPTTPPDIVIGNLERRIRHRGRRISQGRATPLDRKLLISDLLKRAQFLGVVGDYQRAHVLALELASARASDKAAQLLWAQTAAALHRWDEVARAVEAAKRAGADTSMTAAVEADLALALGETARALALRQTLANKRPTPYNIAAVAVVLAERGERDHADRKFEQAIAFYRGSSPLPLVWISFQHGLLWERLGRPAKAATIYERAYSRLPHYAPLASHLAALLAERGQPDRALRILAKAMSRADDPQLLGQRGALLHARGQFSLAAAYFSLAELGYDELLVHEPRAFVDHAVDFYLQLDRVPQRALGLARRAVAERPSGRRFQRLLIAARVAGRPPKERCEYAERAGEQRPATASLAFLRAQAYRDCHRPTAERAALAAAQARN